MVLDSFALSLDKLVSFLNLVVVLVGKECLVLRVVIRISRGQWVLATRRCGFLLSCMFTNNTSCGSGYDAVLSERFLSLEHVLCHAVIRICQHEEFRLKRL